MEKIIRSGLSTLLYGHPVRMHMPGHKGKRLRFDITEIPGADNLHAPDGIIARAQQKIADVYGSSRAFLLVGSSTAGIQAAVMAAAGEGETILMPLNAHRAFYSALAFGRAEPVYYLPQRRCPGMAVTREIAAELIQAHPQAAAMVVVSPDVYGNVSDIAGIAEILHKNGMALIVDEAHGAHLKFTPGMTDAVTAGADYVIQSTHKTLGAPTQGAVLHTQGLADAEKVGRLLAMLESSSPSYLLMMGIEEAVDEAARRAEDVFTSIYRAHDGFAKRQRPDDVMRLVAPDGAYDRSKFVFSVPDGFGVQKRLIEDYRIIPEMAYSDTIVCMTGIGTTRRDLSRLFRAVTDINRALKESGAAVCTGENLVDAGMTLPEIVLPMHAVLSKRGVWVPAAAAAGRVSHSFVVPYPPGVPLLIPGSRVTPEKARALAEMLEAGFTVNGVRGGKILVVEAV